MGLKGKSSVLTKNSYYADTHLLGSLLGGRCMAVSLDLNRFYFDWKAHT